MCLNLLRETLRGGKALYVPPYRDLPISDKLPQQPEKGTTTALKFSTVKCKKAASALVQGGWLPGGGWSGPGVPTLGPRKDLRREVHGQPGGHRAWMGHYPTLLFTDLYLQHGISFGDEFVTWLKRQLFSNQAAVLTELRQDCFWSPVL